MARLGASRIETSVLRKLRKVRGEHPTFVRPFSPPILVPHLVSFGEACPQCPAPQPLSQPYDGQEPNNPIY